MTLARLFCGLCGTWRRTSIGRLHARRAASLIELLVVVVIVLLITGIAIRTVMPSIESRQIREGARQLNVFINSARNRALQTGRPMGIWIDRMPGLAEAAVSISYCQVPEPYCGDYADSGVEAYLQADTSTTSTYGSRRLVNVVRAYSASSALGGGNPTYDFWCMNGIYTPQRVIRPGDTMQLNYRNQSYRLFLDTAISGGPYWAIAQQVNKRFLQDTTYNGTPWPSPNGGWTYTMNAFNDLGDKVLPVVTQGSSQMTHGRPVPYQIFRQPIRSAAGTMQLPDTVVIDLNYSGDDLKNWFPRQGSGTALASSLGYVDTYQGNPVLAETDTTPIIIMFGPSGAMEQVYTWYYVPPSATGQKGAWMWRGDRQMSPIAMLVGTRDHVPANPTATWRLQGNNNWTQPGNIWVAIHARSGLVTSAEILPIPPPANIDAVFAVRTYLITDSYSISTNGYSYPRGLALRGNQMTGM